MKISNPDRMSTSHHSSSSSSHSHAHGHSHGHSSSSTSANSVTRPAPTAFGNGSAGAPRVMDEHLTAQQFAFLAESKLLFTCGHWDHTCRITHVETGNLVQSVRQHRDVITCLALAKDYGQRWLVTGSRDCTLMVWDVHTDKDLPLKPQPQYILYGHDDTVTCVAINPELDIVVSGSDDGTVIIHNLRDGTYVRSITDQGKSYSSLARMTLTTSLEPVASGGDEAAGDLLDTRGRRVSMRPSSTTSSTASNATQQRKVSWVCISKEAYIITYSADDQILCSFSLNGLLISSRVVPETLHALMLSEDGKVLVTGGSACVVVFRWVSTISLR
jgi:WD40 repeat protein